MRVLICFFVLAVVVVAVRWYVFDSRAPASADGVIPLQAMREAIAEDAAASLPRSVDLYRVGSGQAPMFAVEAGGGLGKFRMAYTAFGINYPAGTVMIDAAADRQTAMTIGDAKAARFSDATYALLAERMRSAALVLLTHEHKDHVMAVARHPDLASFSPKLVFPEAQRYGLLRQATEPTNRAILERLPSASLSNVIRVAPGIAVAPSPGHSPGSQIILARLANGKEYLFIGDIAWSFQDIVRLRTRPRFLQWLMFDPNEDRPQVLRQLRALHDIRSANPDLVIVPSHDDAYFDQLLSKGIMSEARR